MVVGADDGRLLDAPPARAAPLLRRSELRRAARIRERGFVYLRISYTMHG